MVRVPWLPKPLTLAEWTRQIFAISHLCAVLTSVSLRRNLRNSHKFHSVKNIEHGPELLSPSLSDRPTRLRPNAVFSIHRNTGTTMIRRKVMASCQPSVRHAHNKPSAPAGAFASKHHQPILSKYRVVTHQAEWIVVMRSGRRARASTLRDRRSGTMTASNRGEHEVPDDSSSLTSASVNEHKHSSSLPDARWKGNLESPVMDSSKSDHASLHCRGVQKVR